MQPIGVHHVSVNVEEVQPAIAFYTEILGGNLRTDRPDFGFGGAWIDFGPQQVHLIEAPIPANQGQHFAVHFADLDAVVNELRSLGITVQDPVAVGTGRQTFVTDPAGNLVELHEVGVSPDGPAG